MSNLPNGAKYAKIGGRYYEKRADGNTAGSLSDEQLAKLKTQLTPEEYQQTDFGNYLKKNGLSPVQDEKAIQTMMNGKAKEDALYSFDAFGNTYTSPSAQDAVDRVSSMASGAGRNMVEYLASGAKLVGADETAKDLDNYRKEINANVKDRDWADAGAMIYDPINLMPAGIISKGSKASKIVKSLGAGFGMGAGTSIAKDYGNTEVSQDEMQMNAVISGAMWGAMNTFFVSGAYDKLSAPIKNKLKKMKEKPHEVTQEQVDTVNSIKNNPEFFGLSPDDAKNIPEPIEMNMNPDGSYSITGNERTTINPNDVPNSHVPNWTRGNIDNPPAVAERPTPNNSYNPAGEKTVIDPFAQDEINKFNSIHNPNGEAPNWGHGEAQYPPSTLHQREPMIEGEMTPQARLPYEEVQKLSYNEAIQLGYKPVPRKPKNSQEALATLSGKKHYEYVETPEMTQAPVVETPVADIPDPTIGNGEQYVHYSPFKFDKLSTKSENLGRTGGVETNNPAKIRSNFLYKKGSDVEVKAGIGKAGDFEYGTDLAGKKLIDLKYGEPDALDEIAKRQHELLKKDPNMNPIDARNQAIIDNGYHGIESSSIVEIFDDVPVKRRGQLDADRAQAGVQNREELGLPPVSRNQADADVYGTIEATPSSTDPFYKELEKATPEQRKQYEELHVPIVKDLAKKHNLDVEVSVSHGAFAGQKNPNLVIKFKGKNIERKIRGENEIIPIQAKHTWGKVDGELDVNHRAEIEEFLKDFGAVTNQDSVAWFSPVYKGSQEGSHFAVEITENLTKKEFDAMYDMLRVNGKEIVPNMVDGKIHFMNFDGIPAKEAERIIEQAIGKLKSGKIGTELNAFESTGNLIERKDYGRDISGGTRPKSGAHDSASSRKGQSDLQAGNNSNGNKQTELGEYHERVRVLQETWSTQNSKRGVGRDAVGIGKEAGSSVETKGFTQLSKAKTKFDIASAIDDNFKDFGLPENPKHAIMVDHYSKAELVKIKEELLAGAKRTEAPKATETPKAEPKAEAPAPEATPKKFEKIDIEDIKDSHGGIELSKLKEGQMVAHDNQVWFMHEGKIKNSLDDTPVGFDTDPQFSRIKAYQGWLDNQRGGFIDSAFASQLGSGGVGGAIGGTQGDTTDERIKNALIGASVGMGATHGLSKVLKRKAQKTSAKAVENSALYKHVLKKKQKPKTFQQLAKEDKTPVKFGESKGEIPKADSDGVKINRPNTYKDPSTPIYAQGVGLGAGIDQDENGNFTFDPEKAFAGLAITAGAMGGMKIFKNRKQATVHANKVKSEYIIKGTEQAFEKIKKMFGTGLKDSYMTARNEAIKVTNANDMKLENLHKALMSVDEESRQAIHKALVGEGKAPEGFESLVNKIRKEVDGLSQELVDNGVLTKETMEEWKGHYLHRSYESHLINNIKKSMSGNLKINELLRRGKVQKVNATQVAEMRASGEITDELLKTPLNKGGIRIVEKLNGQKEIRRDWTPAERKAMKEVTDSAYTIPDTLMQMKRMVEHSKFLKEVSKIDDVIMPDEALEKFGKNGVIPDEILKGSGYVRLGDNAQYGALSGKYIKKEVARDITGIHDDIFNTFRGHDNKYADLWKTYLRTWKISKTALNAPSHVNNIMSNLTLGFLSGASTKELANGITTAGKVMYKASRYKELLQREMMGNMSSAEIKEFAEMKPLMKIYDEAVEAGLFGRSRMREEMMGNIDINKKGIIGKGIQKATDLYQAEDVFGRIALFDTLRKKGHSIEEAGEMVTAVMPDYTKPLPQWVKNLKETGVAPFISWNYYVLPNLVKLLATKKGAIQATKLMATMAGMEYMLTGGAITPLDNIPYMDTNKPEHLKGREMAIHKSGSEITTVKVDRWLPFYELLSPKNFALSTLLSGLPQEALYNTLSENSKVMRKTYNDQPVTYRSKSAGDQAIDYAKHIGQTYVPLPQQVYNGVGLIDSLVRSKKSRTKQKVIQPRSKAQELIKFLGVNSKTYSQRELKKEQRKK